MLDLIPDEWQLLFSLIFFAGYIFHWLLILPVTVLSTKDRKYSYKKPPLHENDRDMVE